MQTLQNELEILRRRQKKLDTYITTLTHEMPIIQSIIHPLLEIFGKKPDAGTCWTGPESNTFSFYFSTFAVPRSLLPLFDQAEDLLGIPGGDWVSEMYDDSIQYSNSILIEKITLNISFRCYFTDACRKTVLRHEEKEVYKMVKEMVPVYQIECPEA